MDIKIDQNGYLHYMRGGEYKEQVCPFWPIINTIRRACGDWCPLFIDSDIYDENAPKLRLCQTILPIYSLIDERI